MAGELATSSDRPREAFRRYEERLRPFIHAKQRVAERFAAAFVPRTRHGIFFRNQMIKAFRVPAIAKVAIGRDIRDQLQLPQYHLEPWQQYGRLRSLGCEAGPLVCGPRRSAVSITMSRSR